MIEPVIELDSEDKAADAEPRIPSALNDLSKRVAETEALVRSLRDRLASVLQPERPHEAAHRNPVEPDATGLAEQIYSIHHDVRTVGQLINDTIRRLDL